MEGDIPDTLIKGSYIFHCYIFSKIPFIHYLLLLRFILVFGNRRTNRGRQTHIQEVVSQAYGTVIFQASF